MKLRSLSVSTRERTLNKSSAGPLSVTTTQIFQGSYGAPHDVLIVHPEKSGSYPLLQFHHGFALHNYLYRQFSDRIASHGFIVVLPQLYRPGVRSLLAAIIPGVVPSPYEEAREVARALSWAVANLPEGLKAKNIHVKADKIALGGHSRGGQAVLLAALKDISPPRHLPKLLVLLDPVDGQFKLRGGHEACVLKSAPWKVKMPVLVVGAQLGTGGFFPSAPSHHNFNDFYLALRRGGSLVSKVVCPNHGHLDYLDDSLPGMLGLASRFFVLSGESGKAPLRALSAALVVSFLDSIFSQRSSWRKNISRLLNGENEVSLEDGSNIRVKGAIESRGT